MQVCACITRTHVHNARMMATMHNNKRPAGLSAGGAFLCAEAWQRGLLLPASPFAWALAVWSFTITERLELDEAWSFVGKKQKNILRNEIHAKGDQYVWPGRKRRSLAGALASVTAKARWTSCTTCAAALSDSLRLPRMASNPTA
jgi:hypothetical protein